MTKFALAALVTAATFGSTAAAPASAAGTSASAAAGAKIYGTNCIGCHGADGVGAAGLFPPLAANPYVSGDAKRMIHTVKYGLSGKIVVKGVTYNGNMPAWEGTLSEAQIADVVTYVRSTWKNKGSAVTAAQVRAVKK